MYGNWSTVTPPYGKPFVLTEPHINTLIQRFLKFATSYERRMRVFRIVKARTAFPHKKRSLIRTVIISGNLLVLFRIKWSSLGISKSDNAIFKPLHSRDFQAGYYQLGCFRDNFKKKPQGILDHSFSQDFSINVVHRSQDFQSEFHSTINWICQHINWYPEMKRPETETISKQ